MGCTRLQQKCGRCAAGLVAVARCSTLLLSSSIIDFLLNYTRGLALEHHGGLSVTCDSARLATFEQLAPVAPCSQSQGSDNQVGSCLLIASRPHTGYTLSPTYTPDTTFLAVWRRATTTLPSEIITQTTLTMPESYVTRGYAIALLAACTMVSLAFLLCRPERGCAYRQAVNGYDSSVFNSVQGYANFVNYYKREGETKINPNILGAVNTGAFDL